MWNFLLVASSQCSKKFQNWRISEFRFSDDGSLTCVVNSSFGVSPEKVASVLTGCCDVHGRHPQLELEGRLKKRDLTRPCDCSARCFSAVLTVLETKFQLSCSTPEHTGTKS